MADEMILTDQLFWCIVTDREEGKKPKRRVTISEVLETDRAMPHFLRQDSQIKDDAVMVCTLYAWSPMNGWRVARTGGNDVSEVQSQLHDDTYIPMTHTPLLRNAGLEMLSSRWAHKAIKHAAFLQRQMAADPFSGEPQTAADGE